MKKTADEIIKIFSYTEAEEELFPYIRSYMKLIRPRLPEIMDDEERLRRFALVGLFLTYRTRNFLGEDFTTRMSVDPNRNVDDYRTYTFQENFDVEIGSTADYLNSIHYSIWEMVFARIGIFDIGRHFFKFVMTGK